MTDEKFAEICAKIIAATNFLMKEEGLSKENALRMAWNHFLPTVPFDDFVKDMIETLTAKV